MRFLLVIFAALVSSTSAVALPRPAAEAAAATTGQIRGVSSPVYHLYLQALPSDPSKPVLGPESAGDTYSISSTVQSLNSSLYLNIGDATTSYKPLSLSKASNTTAWGLEGDTIITTTASKYGRQLNFLACSLAGGYYELWLQTGSDAPSGRSCSNYQTIHLPCLC